MNASLRYVFGSLISGDFDSGSDVDVLVIADNNELKCPKDWSLYTKSGVRNLYKKGTLFAWHLYQDAVPVSSEAREYDFLREIGPPSHYDSALSEIDELKGIIQSAFLELLDSTPSRIFEVGLIAVAVRDIAMAASVHIVGRFDFSKFAPFKLGKLSLDIPKSLYLNMLSCRRATIRGEDLLNIKCPENELMQERESITRWIDTVVEKIERKI
ncbi:nucleotidyltransferase domain-containing protein [Alteromonas sp. D210916BOD_24]|uniref:nucleotidyltransferase domain-containing protein n=1 Tax=Alteromonas sp. D210916BOD_24 TaxID=3157618 RepID=UPI00399C4EF8